MSAVAIAPEPMKPQRRIVPGPGKSRPSLFIPSHLRRTTLASHRPGAQ
jgi:hypothetical protein